MENKNEDKQKIEVSPSRKIFFWFFGLLIFVSVAVTFWRIVVKRDYIIAAEQECDPAIESCFIYECSPEEDSECPEEESERISYYKMIHKNAQNIPPCDAEKGECPTELTCEEGEEDCEFILCDKNELSEGETCSDPEEYLKSQEEKCACEEEEEEEEEEAKTELESEEETNEAIKTEEIEEEVTPVEEGGCSCEEKTESQESSSEGTEEEPKQ